MTLKKIVCLVLMMVGVLSINAQENAENNLSQDKETIDVVSSLYKGWQNSGVRCEGTVPEAIDIDLRDFHMPIKHNIITSPYGPRWGRIHRGIDIKAVVGDTIYAAFSGKIRIVNYEANGYGNYVVIRHNNGLETVYGHMSKHLVVPNQIVKSGQPIGLGGNTGRSTGPHLHFETRLCGIALNPELMFDIRHQRMTGDFYHFKKSEMTVIQVKKVKTKRKK